MHQKVPSTASIPVLRWFSLIFRVLLRLTCAVCCLLSSVAFGDTSARSGILSEWYLPFDGFQRLALRADHQFVSGAQANLRVERTHLKQSQDRLYQLTPVEAVFWGPSSQGWSFGGYLSYLPTVTADCLPLGGVLLGSCAQTDIQLRVQGNPQVAAQFETRAVGLLARRRLGSALSIEGSLSRRYTKHRSPFYDNALVNTLAGGEIARFLSERPRDEDYWHLGWSIQGRQRIRVTSWIQGQVNASVNTIHTADLESSWALPDPWVNASFRSDPVREFERFRWFFHVSNGALLSPRSALFHPAFDLTDQGWAGALGIEVGLDTSFVD